MSPALANVGTTDYTSASSSPWQIPRDVAGYIRSKSPKLARKVVQRLFNRTIMQSTSALNISSAAPSVRACWDMLDEAPQVGTAMEALADLGVMSRRFQLREIPERFRGNAVVLGWLLARLPDKSAAHLAAASDTTP